MRGKIHDTPLGARALVTIHPSALLRAPRGREYDAAYALFVRDLKNINSRGRRSRQATAATPRSEP
jgi:hypothetical protein